MKLLLALGNEFFYDCVVSFMNYTDFKTLQSLSHRFYQHLDQPFYRKRDGNRIRNGISLVADYQKIWCYDGNVKHGPFKAFHMEGTIAGNGFYKHGIPDGPFHLYYKNGMIKSLKIYKDGKTNGPYFEYYPDGKVRLEAFYKNGNLEGPLCEYNQQGTLTLVKNYKNGLLNGKYMEICASWVIKRLYENGKYVGPSISYKNGKLDKITD